MSGTGGTIVILTLEEHRDGVWITQLVDSLRAVITSSSSSSSGKKEEDDVEGTTTTLPMMQVKVVTFESTLEADVLDESPFPPDAVLIVNRISDAAIDYKAVVSLLQCCETLWGLKVFNTAASYSVTSNKWAQHCILARAGLKSPATRRVATTRSGTSGKPHFMMTSRWSTVPRSNRILFKPNAGGFGAGIVDLGEASFSSATTTENPQADSPRWSCDEEKDRYPIPQEMTKRVEEILLASPPPSSDGTALLQEYIPPVNGELFRVWFLLGKVQCGLIRRNDPNADLTDEFTAGCAAKGKCTLADRKKLQPRLLACDMPQEVKDEIELKLLPLMPGAHAGSVEFLVPSSPPPTPTTSTCKNADTYSATSSAVRSNNSPNERLYFDINLLSTLPLIPVVDADSVANVWARDTKPFDPWLELATGIISIAGLE